MPVRKSEGALTGDEKRIVKALIRRATIPIWSCEKDHIEDLSLSKRRIRHSAPHYRKGRKSGSGWLCCRALLQEVFYRRNSNILYRHNTALKGNMFAQPRSLTLARGDDPQPLCP